MRHLRAITTRRAPISRVYLAATCLLLASCANVPDSPRKPFASPPQREQAGEQPAFRVLDHWQWTRPFAAGVDPPPAEADTLLGLESGQAFRLTTGACTDCRVPAPALWYFRDKLIAVPERAIGVRSAQGPADPPRGDPLFVWMQAPQVIEHATLSVDGRSLNVNGRAIKLAITPRLPTNHAYVDGSTVRFFQGHRLRVRGMFAGAASDAMFVARTLWPEDARLGDPAALALDPLKRGETLGTLIQAQTFGTRRLFPVRLLWERHPGGARDWSGKAVAAFVLVGAQSDNDLSLAGHLAVAAGRYGPKGEWNDWLVNNFYPLDKASAKGILPAVLPMDNYLFEFNTGESYYRPGYMLVAVMSHRRAADQIQAAMREELSRYYCRDLTFNLATQNSTAFSVDPLRALGWRIPTLGATSYLAAFPAVPLTALVKLSPTAGISAFQFLTEEQTRLMPRQAFEVLGQDLLYLASAGAANDVAALTPFERTLAEDVEAVLFVRIPQVPSSRPFGSYPLRSLIDYGARAYTEPGPMKQVGDADRRRLPKGLEHACRH